MSILSREVKEGPQPQGEDETVTWAMDTTGVCSTPSNVSVVVKDWPTVPGGTVTDVTSTVYSGTASISGNVITLGPIASLTSGKRYRVEVQFTGGAGAPFEHYFYLDAEA